jgi:cold shock CspA family protein/ribosome-associated translation inhibitor RaiA
MDASPAVEARIREEAAKLDEFYQRIMSCRVVVESPHHHRRRGQRYNIRIDLTVPGSEIVVNHEPSLHSELQRTNGREKTKNQEIASPHKDINVAIRDAFKAARRRLQDFARKQRDDVKHHEPAPQARVSKLFPDEGYGFLETPGGAQIYFYENSVINDSFSNLEVGTVVSFVEEMGEKGPQASTVKVSG